MPISDVLYPFQRDIVEWATRRGKAAIFADCGMGKTLMQLEWARQVMALTGGDILILAPLAVSRQTQREAEKVGLKVNGCRSSADLKPGMNITNYEMLHHFDPNDFAGLVLDESSILKGFDGKYRRQITKFTSGIDYRLACTATPAPNDLIELTNHSEFLGIMGGKEILALFFIQDGNTTHKWRLKGHAEQDFWKWLASWSVAIRKPSDLGHEDEGFILPPMNIHQVQVESPAPEDQLFATEAQGLQDRQKARKASQEQRIAVAADLVNNSNETWIIWCNLNAESEGANKAIEGAVEVKGADSTEHKESTMLGFSDGKHRVLVTKPSIAGFGMNWQHCHNVIFLGLSDSYEQYYQAVRRCWRFGQESEVNVHIITSEAEGAVVSNIERKEREASKMMDNIVNHMRGLSLERATRDEMVYREDKVIGENYEVFLGDTVKRIKEIPDESVGLSVFSPPFPGMYAYTNSRHDMGNVKSMSEMIEQYSYMIPDLLRITKPGRSCCVHLTQGVAFKSQDGYIGIKDFRGEIIKAHEEAGWIYYGEVCIDKDPQVKAIRTKDRGLLFKSLATDSSNMHMALADYMLQFRKPGDNEVPIRAGISAKYGNEDGWISAEQWIEWAAPVWYRQTKDYPGGIRETDVLNVREAREANDEKHLCPLQIGVIERAVKLWSNPGDIVFSPFTGIGSEGYVSVREGRKFVGCELKESYWKVACKNLDLAEKERNAGTLLEVNNDVC